MDRPRIIGVISDTHGLLRPEACAALEGSDLIIHAGDVGGAEILESLAAIAPVRAVRGNTDWGEFAATLPWTAAVETGPAGAGLTYVLHILEDLDLDPAAAGVSVVIHGHTHQPRVHWQGDILFLNPGSAGPRRFDYPVSVARLIVPVDPGGRVEAEILDLDPPPTIS